MKIKPLRGLIFSKFNSEAEFARKLGWPRQRLNKITNGIKEPSVDELNQIACALDVEIGDIIPFFLPARSPNGQLLDKDVS